MANQTSENKEDNRQEESRQKVSVADQYLCELVHDIATPLVVAKLQSELLASHLPQLLRALEVIPEVRSLLPQDENILKALMRAPDVMVKNLLIVQEKTRSLSQALTATISSAAEPLLEKKTFEYLPQGPEVVLGSIKRILLVDDELIHRDIAQSLLADIYKVDFAKNGLEAIALCEQYEYDLILMDLQMPRMNGEQATQTLRKTIPQDVVILGLTSMPIGARREELLAKGFNEFLEKPLKIVQLQAILSVYS